MSKAPSPDEEERHKQEVAQSIRILGPLVFMTVLGGQLLGQSRVQLARSICAGDQLRAAKMLASFGGFAGVAEFLLNPILGRLSDRFGRRPILFLSPVTCAALRSLVLLFPSSRGAIMLERVLSSAVVTGFFSTMRAMLNDKLSGPERVFADGTISIYAGAGSILGPLIEAFVLGKLGARGNFGLVVALNAAVAYVMWEAAHETLPVSEQKPLTLSGCSPLTFLEMFRVSSVNQRLMFILSLQCFGEVRINQDINTLYMQKELGWTAMEVSRFMSCCGLTAILGGKTVKTSIQRLGLRGHTTISNLALALAFFLQGSRSKYTAQYAALGLYILGARKHDAAQSVCTDITLAATDMGKGQVSAALSNFKSMASIFGPLIAGKAYTAGQAINQPGLHFRVIAAMYALAEVLHLSISPEQLGIKV